MMSLWDALRMNMMISYQELVRTFPNIGQAKKKDVNNNTTARTNNSKLLITTF
ncbi:Uncharacterised protein [Klebsiella pneumoniae]|nr:Uncharacterised protein [Klebsiella pneumoniae]